MRKFNGTTNAGLTTGGPAPKPGTKAPNVNETQGVVANAARVKDASCVTPGNYGLSTNPTGPHPAGISKSKAPFTPELGPIATKKAKKSTHPFFGSNKFGY